MRRWRIFSEAAPRVLLGLLALLICLRASAQSVADELGHARYVIQHRSVDEAYVLIAPYLSDSADVRVVRSEQLIEVRDLLSVLGQVEAELEAFDVARRSVWLRVRIVRAERLEVPKGDQGTAGIPPDVGRFLKYNTYATLGGGEMTLREGERRVRLLSEQYGFRVEVRLGKVDPRAETVELELLSLERRLRDVFRPVIQFSEQLQPGKTRVLLATPGPNDRRALFLLLEVRVQEDDS